MNWVNINCFSKQKFYIYLKDELEQIVKEACQQVSSKHENLNLFKSQHIFFLMQPLFWNLSYYIHGDMSSLSRDTPQPQWHCINIFFPPFY